MKESTKAKKLDLLLGLPTMTEIQAFPAYGRSYETVDEALADWNAGKDFRQTAFPGTYFSNRNAPSLKRDGFTAVIFYDGQRGQLGRVFL